MEYADWNGNVDDSASVTGKKEKSCRTVNTDKFSDRMLYRRIGILNVQHPFNRNIWAQLDLLNRRVQQHAGKKEKS